MKPKSCYAYLIDILNKKDFSTNELRLKAQNKEYPPQEVDQAIELLIRQNYLNDKRYAENIIYFYSKTKGINWLNRKMQEKKIPNSIIYDLLNEIEHDEDYSKLAEKIKSKFRIQSSSQIDQALYLKIYRYLGYNGYDNISNVISKVKQII